MNRDDLMKYDYVNFGYIYGALERFGKAKEKRQVTPEMIRQMIGELMYLEIIHIPMLWKTHYNIEYDYDGQGFTDYKTWQEALTNHHVCNIIDYVDNEDFNLTMYQRGITE